MAGSPFVLRFDLVYCFVALETEFEIDLFKLCSFGLGIVSVASRERRGEY